jgi:LL-diaminopimelate aminotransferase
MNNIYQKRRDIVINTLSELGWSIPNVKATFYMWLKTPKGFSSTEFCSYVLEKAGIIITPGIGYGEYGEGYFRLALTVSEDRLKLAMQRLIDNNITFS